MPLRSPHDVRHRRISLLHLRGMPWARIGALVGQRNLAVTANTYSHVLLDERELDYGALLSGKRLDMNTRCSGFYELLGPYSHLDFASAARVMRSGRKPTVNRPSSCCNSRGTAYHLLRAKRSRWTP